MTNQPDPGQNRNRFWDAVTAALLTLALFAMAIASTYTTYLNTQQHSLLEDQRQQLQLVDLHWQKLNQAEILATSGNYPACTEILDEVPVDSDLYQQVQVLSEECYAPLNRQWLANAEAMAADHHLKNAIAQARKITQGSLQAQASDRIQTWSQQIIEIAKRHYAAPTGEFDEAVNVISAIPEGTPLRETSQALLDQWQQAWAGNQHQYEAAKLALDGSDLAKAEQSANSMSSHPFWTPQQTQILMDVEKTRHHFEQIIQETEDLLNRGELGGAALRIQQLPDTAPWNRQKQNTLAQIDILREERKGTSFAVAVSVIGAVVFFGMLKQLF